MEYLFTGENKEQYEKVQAVVIGSPGFVRENFLKYLNDIAMKK